MNQQNTMNCEEESNESQALLDKLLDVLTPGLQVEFDPEEAAIIGAFIEDSLSEEEARESTIDGEIHHE